MDDSVETKRTLEKLEDLPDIDMTMNENGTRVGDLEEVDDDDEKHALPEAMSVDEEDDDVDPLDAFMSGVKAEVKKVTLEDLEKVGIQTNARSRIRLDERMAEDGDVDDAENAVDELDNTELNPEDILALAAKKAKKKDIATVDHSRVNYESFRKEFYTAPPEIAEMSDEEAELLRLQLDSIKIRGVDCPRPVVKWSHFGLPSVW